MTTTIVASVVEAVPVAELGEGPVWDDRAGELVWVDIVGQRIHRWRPGSAHVATVATPSMVGAVALTDDGQLVAAVQDGLRAVGGDWALLRPLEADEPANRANDGRVDPQGRLVQGTMALDETEGAGALYRIDRDGTETLLDGLTISNGLAWSAAGDRLFHIDTPTQQVRSHAYPDVDAARAEAVVTVPEEQGSPDGMTIDVEEHLWVALWGGSAVHRYAPDGELVTVVEVGARNVTSCAFGGDDLSTLWITTAGAFTDRDDDPGGGALFACDPGTRGRREHRLRT